MTPGAVAEGQATETGNDREVDQEPVVHTRCLDWGRGGSPISMPDWLVASLPVPSEVELPEGPARSVRR